MMLLTFIQTEATELSIIFCCLILSAFFSSSETAITSLGTLKVKHLIDSQGKATAHLKIWLSHPGRVITTILVFNNIVNILASSITTHITTRYLASGAIGLATGITTFLVLVFGEIIPKSFAKTHSERIGILSMKVILVVYYLTYPVIIILSDFADFVIKLISGGKKKTPLITEEEIEFMVSEGEKAGVIEDIKKEIIEGAFDFDETKVREIMTPRTDLTACSESSSLSELLETIKRTGHSRIPIYQENIDHIIGIVLAKDLLYSLSEDKPKNMKAIDLMREVPFSPESQSIMNVFKDLKKSKSHIAVIIDEYGGTAGIVTMEDILEEFVGEIQDEFDSEQAKIIKIDSTTFQVKGAINIDEFMEYFEITPSEDDDLVQNADTLAGYVVQLIGEIPKVGQKATLKHYQIEILDVQNKRIELLKIEKINFDPSGKENQED